MLSYLHPTKQVSFSCQSLVSLVYSTHYQFGDDHFSQLLIPELESSSYWVYCKFDCPIVTLYFNIFYSKRCYFIRFSRFNSKEFFRIDIVFRCHGKSYDICNRSYFISFTFRNRNEKINDCINCRRFIIGNQLIRYSKRNFL